MPNRFRLGAKMKVLEVLLETYVVVSLIGFVPVGIAKECSSAGVAWLLAWPIVLIKMARNGLDYWD